MRHNVITADKKDSADKQKRLLDLELAEVREISEMMFKKLERKIQALEALEATADKKIEALERLLQRADTTRSPDSAMNRQQEIVALRQKGLGHQEIAEVLDMPLGEVELILALNLQQP